MASILLVTPDPLSAERVAKIARRVNVRLRFVQEPEAAREWLSMQPFEVMLVDARFGGSIPTDLLALGWKYHPMLIGGILDYAEELQEHWTAVMLGAPIFSGTDLFDKLEAFLLSLPESYSLQQNSYAVLVLEDLDSPRDIICAYVESLGYSRVDGAGSAEDALEMLRTDSYSYFCVLSDIQMPGENGIEFVRMLRKDRDKYLARLPVVMLTSVSTPENLLECLEAGATGFLTKPPKKKLLNKELEKAKRIVLAKQSPRLCEPGQAYLLEGTLRKMGIL